MNKEYIKGMKSIFKNYKVTANTYDADARKINYDLNDVARMCLIGHRLNRILEDRFDGCLRTFKRWCRTNLDKDEKSIIRYMALADNEEMLRYRGIIRLSEAYEILGIDGNLNDLCHGEDAANDEG